MRIVLCFFSLCAGLIYSNFCLSQDLSRLSPEKPIRDLVMYQWTAEDGLISNNLTSVNHSSDGFIWITSFNGALKFDGSDFQLFDLESLDFLNSNAFISSSEDEQGSLWFATQASGILKYSNWEFKEFSNNDEIPKYIRAVYKDNDDRLWIGSNNLGLFLFDNEVVEKISVPGLNEISIMDINGDKLGKKYFATAGKGFTVYHNEAYTTYTEEDGLASDIVNEVFIALSGRVYIGTLNGISIFDGQEISKLDFLKGIEINKIVEDNLGSIWFATEMGLVPSQIMPSRSSSMAII